MQDICEDGNNIFGFNNKGISWISRSLVTSEKGLFYVDLELHIHQRETSFKA
jgi:hypothetical protein